MNAPITVHKLNEAEHEVWRYKGTVLERTPTSVRLEACFDNDDIDLNGLQLRRGDRFIEIFYSDRWYNIFSIFDTDDDHHKGWYCNICRPARIKTRHVYAEDLALDLVILPNGKFWILDEDEFANLKIPPEDRQRALETLEHLQKLAAVRGGPFRNNMW
jgi:predicted RNA-binding protein associated with RNAse of E/G family